MPGNRPRNARGRGRINSAWMNQDSSNIQPFASDNNRSSLASSGPLVTNHLQLHDLDLELALLKRKREMIEKQHNMLVTESRFGGSSQYGLSQASQSYGQRSETIRNFSNYYNDPPAPQYDRFSSSQGVKRPAIDPWDNSPPKRFTGQKPASRYDEPSRPDRLSRPKPADTKPPPLMSSTFRPRRSRPANRPTVATGKVTKPRQNNAPNKLDTHPIAERKKIVQAMGVIETPKVPLILDSENMTNRKLVGRLELALGLIVREMKETYGTVEPHVPTFTSMSALRAIKQILRQRIRAVMLGKPVGTGLSIVDAYRKEHPKETDVEVLNQARESTLPSSSLAIEIIQQGNPEAYFRNNMNRLLDVTLTEMFERLEQLYSSVTNSETSVQTIIDNMLKDIEKSLTEIEPVPEEVDESIEVKADEIADKDSTEAKDKVLETATATGETAANPEENSETTKKTEEDKPKAEDEPVIEDKPKAEDEPMTEDKPKTEDNSEPKSKPEKEDAKTTKRYSKQTPKEDYIKSRFYNVLLNTLLKRSLPAVLPKYKAMMIRIITSDKSYTETRDYLIKTAKEKAEAQVANRQNANPPQSSTTGEKSGKCVYFARVQGRPSLPKKQQMKTFLDQFHPTLIKKHRSIHNVLFISFDSKENFDNILAKNGTQVASSKLDIRVSERINKNKPQAKNDVTVEESKDNDVEVIDPKTESIKLDESLEDQITDLLSSIREDEENREENGKPNGEAIVIADEENKDEIQETKTEEKKTAGDEPANEEKQPELKETDKELKEEETPAAAANDDVEVVKNVEGSDKNTPATPARNLRTRRTSKLNQN